jgi:tetratricopeptide (TPR) repeat protein/predicted Ser/Thr protein kinase
MGVSDDLDTVEVGAGPHAESKEVAFGIRGSTVGRYVLQDPIGLGGAGIVFSAYDPTLDRKVALKFLRAGADGAATASAGLGGEAKALARLSHPNIVQVYEIDAFEDRIFVAMEFVEGVTLRRWQREEPRSWRETVRTYLQAGEGLAAAHHVGLVHRDFKPDNVLVSTKNRVIVLDFGLATVLAGLQAADASHVPQVRADGTSDATSGTPRYMAPEQHEGLEVDARVDQYSFCLSLYEALYDDYPFKDESIAKSNPDAELRALVLRKKERAIRKPGAKRQVPGWIRPILVRGLSPSPSDRYPGLEPLLADLRRGLHAGQGRRIAAAGVVVALGLAFVGFNRMHEQRAAICRGAPAKLVGVWDDAKREEIRSAFASTGVPYAGDAFHTVGRALDGYAEAWSNMNRDACEATVLRGEQSQELMDLRMECLGQRRQALAARVEIFRKADSLVVEKAPLAANSLPALDLCANASALRSVVREPEDAEQRRLIAALRSQSERARALTESGKVAEGGELAEATVRDAKKVQFAPLEADALLVLGSSQETLGKYSEATATLREAIRVAQRAHADEAVVRALTTLVLVVGGRLAQFAEADQWARDADVFVERVGRGGSLEAQLLSNVASVAVLRGDPAQALPSLRKALEVQRRISGPEHPLVGKLLSNIAFAAEVAGDPEESLRNSEQALEVIAKTAGPRHPYFGMALVNKSMALLSLRRYEEVIVDCRTALEILEKTVAPSNLFIAYAVMNLSESLRARGENDEALRVIARAVTIIESISKDHLDLPEVLITRGLAEQALGRGEQGVKDLERAVAICDKAGTGNSAKLARVLWTLGRVLNDQGRFQRAAASLERALLVGKEAPMDRLDRAETNAALAHALFATEKDLARAQSLLADVRTAYGQEGKRAELPAVELEKWAPSFEQRMSRSSLRSRTRPRDW